MIGRRNDDRLSDCESGGAEKRRLVILNRNVARDDDHRHTAPPDIAAYSTSGLKVAPATKANDREQVEGKPASELSPRLESQYPGFHFSLAFDFDNAARLENELVLELFVDGARHLNRVGNSTRLHAARQVHCVTP